jgi:acyl-CoA dehydrogenase
LFAKFASAGFLVPNLSSPLPVKLLKEAGISELPGGLKVEEFDYLHTLIYTDEVRSTLS